MSEPTIKGTKEQNRKHVGEVPATSQPEQEFGEGDYKAAREYDQATEKFVRDGKVEAAAAAAKPRSASEAAAMESAEAEGRNRGKGEDPLLRPGSKVSSKK